jgi:murein DD-endopeptidase MepM/ murein hydrolase activator NlpD
MGTNPVPGKKITTPYGKPGRLWKTGYHVGADYAAPKGTPIVAVKDGKVLQAKNKTIWGPAYGIAAIIDHGNGIRAIYAHMSKVLVKAGEVVKEGQKIGEVGSTGNSTGPHLHLETRIAPWRYNNKDVNPDVLLNDGPIKRGPSGAPVAAAKPAAPAKKAPAIASVLAKVPGKGKTPAPTSKDFLALLKHKNLSFKKGNKNSEQAKVAAILRVKNPENALSAEIVKAYEKSSDALKVKAFNAALAYTQN